MNSNNNIQSYFFDNYKQIRTVLHEDQPYFVGKDVAEALGYRNTADAIRKHVDEEDKQGARFAQVSGSETIIINESGVFSLIMRSRRKEAKQFKRWVTSEVLPSIRKHGGYIQGQNKLTMKAVDNLYSWIHGRMLPYLQEIDRIDPRGNAKDSERATLIRLAAERVGVPLDLAEQLYVNGTSN